MCVGSFSPIVFVFLFLVVLLNFRQRVVVALKVNWEGELAPSSTLVVVEPYSPQRVRHCGAEMNKEPLVDG